MHGFSPNFQDVLSQDDLNLIKIYTVSSKNNGNTEYLGVLTFVGVKQPKPVHGFSPIVQNMLTKMDLELLRFWKVFGNALNIFRSLTS